jgi:hypothetical protein
MIKYGAVIGKKIPYRYGLKIDIGHMIKIAFLGQSQRRL